MAQVQVKEGTLEGELVDNDYGGSFYSFKGIPYAEPPLGDLRFKAPIPKNPWSGVRNAKEFGPICYQGSPAQGSEDCLYLNIYSPDLKPKSPLPVMFWVHGGAFVSGSGNDDIFGPEFLIKHDVILVTINYRLEVLGFLCLDTPEVPGNAGMKDQVQALRWVNENIANFGGNPQNITIFGQSAGACSVSYHLISPMSKGLFKRAIVQSGSCASWWSQVFNPKERAYALARKLGYNADVEDIYSFYKNLPVESLVGTKVPLTLAESVRLGFELYFGVVNEKQFGNNEVFFSGDVFKSLPDAIDEGVEILSGYTEDEGIILFTFGEFEKMYAQADEYPIYFTPKRIAMDSPMKDQFEAGQKLHKFYIDNLKHQRMEWERLAQYHGFEIFVYYLIKWAKICASKRRLYFYKLTCKTERNISVDLFGLSEVIGNKQVVCHCDDLFYLFNGRTEKLNRVSKDSETFKSIENITTLWTNFAKAGNPTPDNTMGVIWEPYNQDEEKYLEIGEKLEMKAKPDYKEIQFWNDIFRQHAPMLP